MIMAAFTYHIIMALSLHLPLCTNALKLHQTPLWEYVDLEVKPQQLRSRKASRGKGPTVYDNLTDPKIGTGGHGHTFPGATAPWGMVQVTPWIHSEDVSSWDTQSGYHADVENAIFYGMAHTALSGAGSGEMGELRLLPLGPGHDGDMYLDMKSVSASVGYFSSYVMPRRGWKRNRRKARVFVESTAAPRGGVHRFTFLTGQTPSIEVALGETPGAFWGYELVDHTMKVVSDLHVVEGCTSSQITGIGHATSLLCFAIEFDKPFLNVEVKNSSIVLDFSSNGTIVNAVAGVSRTDLEHARGSLSDLKAQGQGFDTFVALAREKWTTALGAVQVEMSTPSQMKVFYTALYHSMITPSLLSDADGSYRLQGSRKLNSGNYSNSGQPVLLKEVDAIMPIRRAQKGSHMYSTFSLWDTYRTLHPLMNLIQPEMSRQFGQSLITMAETWGYLPPWQLIQSPCDMMNGDGGSIILSTMARNGILDKKDVFKVVRMARKAPVDERKYLDVNGVVADGLPKVADAYIPEHVSRFLEQAKADHCVSSLASDLHEEADAKYFHKRSDLIFGIWKADLEVFSTVESYDASSTVESNDAFSTVDSNAAFSTVESNDPFGTEESSDALREDLDTQTESYTEGSARQYSWAADFDIERMVQQRGGKEKMACKLDRFFDGSTQHGQEDMSGNIGSASLGNEPTMHTPLLYSRIGYPWRTQFQIDRAVKQLFSDAPNGLPGNDDLGQMSSWVVFLMLGLYPSECSNEYIIGRPFVNSARISIKDNVLAINVVNQSDDNKYVQRATWEGQELDLERAGLTFDKLSKGGALQIWMSNSPVGRLYSCSE
jgi:predicted alpha-1,2-mannosidase